MVRVAVWMLSGDHQGLPSQRRHSGKGASKNARAENNRTGCGKFKRHNGVFSNSTGRFNLFVAFFNFNEKGPLYEKTEWSVRGAKGPEKAKGGISEPVPNGCT